MYWCEVHRDTLSSCTLGKNVRLKACTAISKTLHSPFDDSVIPIIRDKGWEGVGLSFIISKCWLLHLDPPFRICLCQNCLSVTYIKLTIQYLVALLERCVLLCEVVTVIIATYYSFPREIHMHTHSLWCYALRVALGNISCFLKEVQ